MCVDVPALVLHCVICYAISPKLSSLWHCSISKDRLPQALHKFTSTTPNSCQPWTALRPWSVHNSDITARDWRGGTCTMWSHGSHVTSSRALCGTPSSPLRCCIIMQYWHKVVGAACLGAGHRLLVPLQPRHSVKERAVRTRCLLDLQ